MFRLLGSYSGPVITLAAAVSLSGLATDAAREALRELHDACLLTEPAPGRYTCHDLIHAYATEQASAPQLPAAPGPVSSAHGASRPGPGGSPRSSAASRPRPPRHAR
jgi:hypothetical protein